MTPGLIKYELINVLCDLHLAPHRLFNSSYLIRPGKIFVKYLRWSYQATYFASKILVRPGPYPNQPLKDSYPLSMPHISLFENSCSMLIEYLTLRK